MTWAPSLLSRWDTSHPTKISQSCKQITLRDSRAAEEWSVLWSLSGRDWLGPTPSDHRDVGGQVRRAVVLAEFRGSQVTEDLENAPWKKQHRPHLFNKCHLFLCNFPPVSLNQSSTSFLATTWDIFNFSFRIQHICPILKLWFLSLPIL